jgi:hypothetical protein
MTTAHAGWWQVPDHLVLTDAWARGEHLIASPDPLGLSRRCPRAGRCEVCDGCLAAGNPPLVRSWAGAVERVLAHGQHLDLDVGEMRALLYGECGGGGDDWG